MRNFLYRLRNSFIRFMSGRYGTDKLNRTMIITALVFEVIDMIMRRLNILIPAFICTFVSMLLLTFAIARTFSKNIAKRRAENQKFIKISENLKMRKHYHIYRCSSCSQKIRIPRKGGKKVEIRCPKCGNTFIKII